MSLLGGMTADGALVVIEGRGPRWRVENAVSGAGANFWRERARIERPAFPVVLDHRAWEGEDPLARALLRAGWDVRPPRCERGEEACPAPAMGRGDLGDAIYWDLVEGVPGACQEALALACYAITHLGDGEEDASGRRAVDTWIDVASWRPEGTCLVILLRGTSTAALFIHPTGMLRLDDLHPHDVRHRVHELRKQGRPGIIASRNPVVLNCFDTRNRDDLERVFLLDSRGRLRPILALHDEMWLACAKLGTLYDQMALEVD